MPDPHSINWPDTINLRDALRDDLTERRINQDGKPDERAFRRFWRGYVLLILAVVALPFIVRCS